jgi:hypothetical protein
MVGLGISNSGGMRGADIMLLDKQESVTAGSVWQVGLHMLAHYQHRIASQTPMTAVNTRLYAADM